MKEISPQRLKLVGVTIYKYRYLKFRSNKSGSGVAILKVMFQGPSHSVTHSARLLGFF